MVGQVPYLPGWGEDRSGEGQDRDPYLPELVIPSPPPPPVDRQTDRKNANITFPTYVGG